MEDRVHCCCGIVTILSLAGTGGTIWSMLRYTGAVSPVPIVMLDGAGPTSWCVMRVTAGIMRSVLGGL